MRQPPLRDQVQQSFSWPSVGAQEGFRGADVSVREMYFCDQMEQIAREPSPDSRDRGPEVQIEMYDTFNDWAEHRGYPAGRGLVRETIADARMDKKLKSGNTLPGINSWDFFLLTLEKYRTWENNSL